MLCFAVKPLLQPTQINGFSPVCIWRCSIATQIECLSPVCIRLYTEIVCSQLFTSPHMTSRYVLWLKPMLQPTQLKCLPPKYIGYTLRWIAHNCLHVFIWLCILCFVVKPLLQLFTCPQMTMHAMFWSKASVTTVYMSSHDFMLCFVVKPLLQLFTCLHMTSCYVLK